MTGCMPIVLTTTPPQPASNARRMFESDSVGGADASRKGFSKSMPVNRVARVALMTPTGYAVWRADPLVLPCAHGAHGTRRTDSSESRRFARRHDRRRQAADDRQDDAVRREGRQVRRP